MPPRELSIDDERAVRLIRERELGGVFEQLRRTRRPMTLADVAASTGLDAAVVQRHLDHLEEHGIVERLPTSSRRPRAAYRVVQRDAVIRYAHPEHRARVKELISQHLAHVQRVVQSNGKDPSDDGHAQWFGCYCSVLALTESEAAELGRRLEAVIGYLQQVSMRTPARDEIAPLANHAVTIRSGPLEPRVLPLPTVRFLPDGAPAPKVPGSGDAGWNRSVLSAREQQVGAAYLRGLTRAQVAKELGLSENSVATFTKRLYRKLGISRRGSLAARLAEVLGTPGVP